MGSSKRVTDLVVGVDGGGTKTHAVVVDTRGEVLGVGTAGGSNWEVSGLDGMQRNVATAIDTALLRAHAPRSAIAMCIYALAGCDWESDVERLDAPIAELGLSGARRIVNDAFAVLRAGSKDAHGIASVAGTGGSSTGKNRSGERFRTFAIGYGEGSGAWGLVRGALDAIAQSYHAQRPPTLLTNLLLDACGFATVPALFEALSRGGRHHVSAALAPLVFDAARGDDVAAIAISSSCARQHAADVVGVARSLSMLDDSFDVVCAGGVHRASDDRFSTVFRDRVASEIPGARFVLLDVPPVAGAVLIGCELLGSDVASFQQQLHHQLRTEIAMSENR